MFPKIKIKEEMIPLKMQTLVFEAKNLNIHLILQPKKSVSVITV